MLAFRHSGADQDFVGKCPGEISNPILRPPQGRQANNDNDAVGLP